MIERTLFSADHVQFRDTFRRFLEREVLPHHARWEEQGHVDRSIWELAGRHGFLCPSMPEAFGGAGADRLCSVILFEEIARAGASGLGFGLHSEIVAPYLLRYGSPAQQARWLPAMARGEVIGAIAMTEPAAGSDLQGIQTVARDCGDHFRVTGSKTFITNGFLADLVIVVVKTDPDAGARGTSLLLLEAGMPGFDKGRPLGKLGMKAQDTAELFFDGVVVPRENLLGEINRGFVYLMQELPWERLQIAISAVASAQAVLESTLVYTRERKVFGKTVASFQNTRFILAECQTELQIARVFVDRCCELMMAEQLDTATASMAKYWCTDLQNRVIDTCLQLHGGYGYLWDYPVARAWADARVQRIYGGTNEIMKEVVARSMGLSDRDT